MAQALNPTLLLSILLGYFMVLIGISIFTKGNQTNDTFFKADKNSHWVLVAIGMIGASLSGVTFISIPGVVGLDGVNKSFSYMQMVFGYLVGYAVIATVLMPIYYKYNLTSIYGFLEKRLGKISYKTGAAFFLLSRLVGSSFRLYLVAIVLDKFVTGPLGLPFFMTVLFTILLIWVYTYQGGIKTIVVTDVFQTVMMVGAVIFTILALSKALDTNIMDLVSLIQNSKYSQLWFFDGGWNDPNNFYKQFISGALIALVMTGLDQDMMQKNLTCRNLKDAQKNMFTFSTVLVITNLLFLTLGAMLYLYVEKMGIAVPSRSDYLYPTLALQYLSPFVGILFLLGLIAAAYSSADSALTALTTSFCVDFLDIEKASLPEQEKIKKRKLVHVGFSIGILLTIMIFKMLNDDAVINGLFKAAGYTYGPLLGLFTYAILTKLNIKDKWVWIVCIISPILTYIIDQNSAKWLNGFSFGNMNILVNGVLTFMGLITITNWSKARNI